MPHLVRDVQPTPNPNAFKLVLDRPIDGATDHPLSFHDAESAAAHPLAAALFSIPGVASVLFLNDFITINKDPVAKWPEIRRKAERIIKSS